MSRKGFTLIELLVVVAVLALLASIVFSNLGGAREGARISNALSFQSQTHSLLGSDLVGWWNFNDPLDRYKDLSGSGNNGSCTSCPTPVDGVSGTGGTAMEFDGVGDYIDVGNDDSLNITNEITVSVWVNLKEAQTGSIIDKSWGNGYALLNLSGINIKGYYSGGGFPDYNGVNANEPISLNEWSHIVYTFTTSSAKIFINTVKVADKVPEGNITLNPTVTLKIGGNSYFFNGLIDDVRIYSRALTASEVQGLYAQTKDNYLAND